MPYYGAVAEDSCLDCQPGYYCPDAGTVDPIACETTPGYYCPEGTGADTDRSSCTYGHFCPEKAHMEYKCELGAYTDSDWIAADTANNWFACDTCTEGSYCIANLPADVIADTDGTTTYSGTETKLECTDEYYCEAGFAYPAACKEGYKTAGPGATSEDSGCIQIEFTKWQRMPTGYDTDSGTWETKGTIENGISPDTTLTGTMTYFGTDGTDSIPGEADKWATLSGTPCPVGSNCIQGVRTSVPGGRYIDYEWAAYVDSSDATLPAADADIGSECLAGYYCLEGCTRSRPLSEIGTATGTDREAIDDKLFGNIC
jgi:hypothetical protein